MLPLNAFVKFASYIWNTGKHLIDVEVVLGSADKSSSCKVSIADPDHTIAEAVINHSLKAGGIEALPDPAKDAKAANIPDMVKEAAGTGRGSTKGWASPEEHAFADMVAWTETQAAKDGDFAKSYLAKNGVGGNVGDMTPAEIAPGAGFPASAGTGFNVGRYQFKREDWADAVRAGYAKDFTPEDQDGIARYKFYKLNRGGKELNAGDLKAAIVKAGGEWASVPGSSYGQVQAGYTTEKYINYYNTQLAKYKGGNNSPKPQPL